MGGKRTSGRSSSGGGAGGGHMYPRISSGDSTKNSLADTLSKKGSRERDVEEDEDLQKYSPRKSSFDIISLLEGQEEEDGDAGNETGTDSGGVLYRDFNKEKRGNPAESLPSFWHFVQPETTNHRHNELFHHNRTLPLYKKEQNNPVKHKINSGSQTRNGGGGAAGGSNPSLLAPPPQPPPNKRMMKRKKGKKKVQSAKVAGFEMLERSPESLQREGVEWIRVLTPPPGTDASSVSEVEDDDEEEDDELIKRYFSGLSSAGSSISWAEDAMESGFTSQLSKLWEDIEVVCSGGGRPEKMSNAVYDECLQWRKAFPNANLHRFTRNEVELSPIESPTLEEEDHLDGEVGDDAPFSSLVHSPNYYPKTGRKPFDESVNTLQANFRTLNCATPRPNIEKSTEYVSAWLSECQSSSYVPDHNQKRSALVDYNNGSRTSSPPLSLKNHHPDSASPYGNYTDEGNARGKARHSLRLVSDVARSSYAHFSRSHAKFVSEPDSENFFTSLALANNENNYRPGFGPSTDNYGFHQRRIHEYDEDGDGDADDDDGGRESPNSVLTEIVSFRPNARVQRPISSRVRDHTITPLATGYPHNAFGGGGAGAISRHGINLNRQPTLTTVSDNSRNPLPVSHENHQRRILGKYDGYDVDSSTSPTQSAVPGSGLNGRIRSGLMKQGQTLGYGGGGGRGSIRPQQDPWSRHSGEDHLAVDSNYVTSLYENYQSGPGGGISSGIGGGGRGCLRPSLRSAINSELRRSPTTALMKDSFLNYDRGSAFDEGPGSIPDCSGNDRSYKPMSSWLMSRKLSPNS